MVPLAPEPFLTGLRVTVPAGPAAVVLVDPVEEDVVLAALELELPPLKTPATASTITSRIRAPEPRIAIIRPWLEVRLLSAFGSEIRGRGTPASRRSPPSRAGPP